MAISSLALLRTILSIPDGTTSDDTRLRYLLDASDAAVKSYCKRDFELTTYPGTATGGTGDSGYYSGNGQREIILRQYPVISITSVYLDAGGFYGQGSGAFAATTLLTSGTDYYLAHDGYLNGASCSFSARLVRRSGTVSGSTVFPPDDSMQPMGSLSYPYRQPVWTPGEGNIKVSYTAGYAASVMPGELVQAVNQLAAWMRNNTALGGLPIQQESLGDYSYQLSQGAFGSLNAHPDLGTTRQLLARFRRLTI